MCLLVVAMVTASFACLLLTLLAVLYRSDADFLLMFRERFGHKPEKLSGQVVWITGASSGIGEQTAYHLARIGCRLVLSARRSSELERVKVECLRAGNGKLSDDDVLILVLDSVKFDTHEDAVQQVIDHFGKIDILINNAGRAQRASWLEIELEVDRSMHEVNVLGPVSLTQQVLPHMMARKSGHIVVTSSIAGKYGLPNSRSYNGSKYALHGHFECLRTEMGKHNIDVTIICPGPVFSNAFEFAATSKHGENLSRTMAPTERRVSTDRCAHLITVAIANRMYEAWISLHPWLLMLYISQYWPSLERWIFVKFGTEQLMKMREGQ